MPADGAGRVVALTGATGFIGRRLLPQLIRAGWRPRILVRRDPADLALGEAVIDVVLGDLGDAAALSRLVDGADAVLHLAGLIKAPRRQDFFRANVDGSRRLARAAALRGLPMLLVSSLAAREPTLSDYAASKRAAEDAVFAELGASRVSVIRPPAVYGPGDAETLVFFQLARLPWVPLLGAAEARNALIHVDDLVAALVAQLAAPPTATVHAVSDDHAAGYGWRQIMEAAAAAQGLAPRGYRRVPVGALRTVAGAGDLGRRLGKANMLSSGKLRELLHPDWAVPAAERLVPPGWSPSFDLASGFADAAEGYRRLGWLRA